MKTRHGAQERENATKWRGSEGKSVLMEGVLRRRNKSRGCTYASVVTREELTIGAAIRARERNVIFRRTHDGGLRSGAQWAREVMKLPVGEVGEEPPSCAESGKPSRLIEG